MSLKPSETESQRLDRLAKDALFDQLTALDRRLHLLEHGEDLTADTSPLVVQGGDSKYSELINEISHLKKELYRVNDRAASMRLDRQAVLAFKKMLNIIPRLRASKKAAQDTIAANSKIQEITAQPVDVALICPVYPGHDRKYGGEFIQKRVKAYTEVGLKVLVIEANKKRQKFSHSNLDGIDILRVDIADLAKALRYSKFKVLAAHSIEKDAWSVLKQYTDKYKTFIWIHGFEARDWKELAFNYSSEDLDRIRFKLDRANEERRRTMREIFAHKNVEVIFVSEFMKTVAERFVRTKAMKSHIIHNSIESRHFPFVQKNEEHRKKILWVRTFSAHNYANDISRDVLLKLKEKDFFDELEITIYGEGPLFREITEPLRKFTNVKIHNHFLNQDELRLQHQKHGLMLVPTRWDSQGLTSGEAMASGLVVLTNNVAAIPEFADETCAILAAANDSDALVEGVCDLYNNPDKFLEMSQLASQKAKNQCDKEHTLDKEISLLRTSEKALNSNSKA